MSAVTSGPARMGASIGGAWGRLSARTRLITVGVVVAAVIAGTIFALVSGGQRTIQITADFPETPGLYPGNDVDVLGISVGHISSITPGPTTVRVRMTVDANIKLPANVGAFLMAPNVVNDRYVQLDPAYTSGPQLSDGAVIPTARTEVPVSVDQIIGSLDTLARALGPQGANSSGALSQLLHSVATEYDHQGTAIHTTVSSFGQALSALSTHSQDLTSVITNLGSLSHAAAQASMSYQSFAADLAAVSTSLNGDSSSIITALHLLQQALGQVTPFVRNNAAGISGSVTNLDRLAAALAGQQKQLAQLFSAAPLALENLSAAYDPSPPGGGGPALRSRLDILPGSTAFQNSVCGNSVLRLLVLAVDQQQDTIPTIDLACGVGFSLGALPVPPGGVGPNMSLAALLKAGQ